MFFTTYKLTFLRSLWSAWHTSASLRASTAPSIPPIWSLRPQSRTRCRRSPCPTLSTSAWSSLRSPVPKISTMLCWSALRRSRERDSLKASCRLGLNILILFLFYLIFLYVMTRRGKATISQFLFSVVVCKCCVNIPDSWALWWPAGGDKVFKSYFITYLYWRLKPFCSCFLFFIQYELENTQNIYISVNAKAEKPRSWQIKKVKCWWPN